MCKNNLECEECGQLAFIPLLRDSEGNLLCENCKILPGITEEMEDLMLDSPESVVIKLTLDGNNGNGEEIIYLPFEESLDYKNIYPSKEGAIKFMELIRNEFYEIKYIKEEFLLLRRLKFKNYSTAICFELDIPFYIESEQSRKIERFTTPWEDTFQPTYISCDHAYEIFTGEAFERDYAYFTCNDCERIICKQNPSNGYKIQYISVDNPDDIGDLKVCNSCFQTKVLEKGLAPYITEDSENSSFHKDFFCKNELIENGWTYIEDYNYGLGEFSGNRGEDGFYEIHEIAYKLILEQIPVLINIDSMAIGGLGADLELWVKQDEETLKKLITTLN